jgi:hypothetical protein
MLSPVDEISERLQTLMVSTSGGSFQLLRASDATLNEVGPVVVWSRGLNPAEFEKAIESTLQDFEKALEAAFFPRFPYVTPLLCVYSAACVYLRACIRACVRACVRA